MTDLRQAAQAVIDDFEFMRYVIDEKLWKSIEALRQALVDAPSVEALIFDILNAFKPSETGMVLSYADAKPILDKYRSK